jgi:hypothetical protein
MLSGLMVSLLAIGPTVHGVKPSQGLWIFKVNKHP